MDSQLSQNKDIHHWLNGHKQWSKQLLRIFGPELNNSFIESARSAVSKICRSFFLRRQPRKREKEMGGSMCACVKWKTHKILVFQIFGLCIYIHLLSHREITDVTWSRLCLWNARARAPNQNASRVSLYVVCVSPYDCYRWPVKLLINFGWYFLLLFNLLISTTLFFSFNLHLWQ